MNLPSKEKLYFIKFYFNHGSVLSYNNLTMQRIHDFINIHPDYKGFYVDPMIPVNDISAADAYDMINLDQVLMIEVGLSENLPCNERANRDHNLFPGF
jgi:hypothetical protein